MTRRLKVLASVNSCSPLRGSEPGLGWCWVEALAEHHDLWVITAATWEPDIEAELARRPELRQRVRVHYIAQRRRPALRKVWPPSYYWYYRQWQWKAYELARELHQEVTFDLVHHVNITGFREPGYLWKLGVPFVWGPVAGMQLVPWGLLPALGARGAVFHGVKNLLNLWQAVTLRRPRIAARRAGQGLIAANSTNARAIRRRWGLDSQVICETGPPISHDMSPGEPISRRKGEPLRLVWSGVHIHRKALPLLLRALSLLPPEVNCTLDILGDGPLQSKWRRLSRRLGVDDRCIWHGRVPREKALALMRAGHVFVFTSVAEATGTVVLEALALGLPVIGLDLNGLSDVVTDECGIKIPPTTPSRVALDLMDAIERLHADEPHRQQLAEHAVHRMEELAWQRRARQVDQIYQQKAGICECPSTPLISA